MSDNLQETIRESAKAPAKASGDAGSVEQHKLTGDAFANRFVEQEFFAWADAIGLAEKLRTMRLARVSDGESFGLLTSNPRIDSPVQLDLKLVEAEQVTSPILALDSYRYLDGIRFDEHGNAISYDVLREHPGDDAFSLTENSREFKGPVYIARKSTLGEVSFVALGADDDTTARLEAGGVRPEEEDAEDPEEDMEELEPVNASLDLNKKLKSQASGLSPVQKMRIEAAAESKRIAGIRKVCVGKHPEIEARALEEGWSVIGMEESSHDRSCHSAQRVVERLNR